MFYANAGLRRPHAAAHRALLKTSRLALKPPLHMPDSSFAQLNSTTAEPQIAKQQQLTAPQSS
jgi:hypothetical protein